MNYHNYSVIDFVMDEYFQQWVQHPDQETDAYWNQWLKDHPDKHFEIHEARKLILLQHFKTTAVPTSRLVAIRESIKKNGNLRPVVVMDKKARKSGWSLGRIKAVAAVTILLTLSISLYLLNYDYPRTIATGYGQIKEITLPDGSAVVLNANSMLEYAKNWEAGHDREIWLRGEAFFEVAKLADKQDTSFIKFIVHVGGLDVEVVGTQFNVNNRNGAVKVVLNEGKVRVKAKDGKEVNMVPGEMLSYLEKSKAILKEYVDPEKHISWRNYHLIFEGEPLHKIANILETNYGVQVIFADPQLSEKKITGILPSDSLEVILEALETIYSIKIEKQGDRVLFQK